MLKERCCKLNNTTHIIKDVIDARDELLPNIHWSCDLDYIEN